MNVLDAPFNLPISLRELIFALVNSGRATGYFLIDNVTLNPLTSVTYTIPVVPKVVGGTIEYQLATPISFLALPDPDHTVAMTIEMDDMPMVVDSDMVAGIYTEEVNFLRDVNFFWWAKREIKVTYTNTSATDTATVNFRFIWATMSEEDMRRIERKYIEAIKVWLLDENNVR